MGGGKDSGSDVNPTANPYAQAMARMGKELYQETDPLRNAMINEYGGFFGLTNPITVSGPGGKDQTYDWNYDKYGSTNFPLRYSPIINASRSGIENAYTQGRNNLIGSMPRGGALYDAMSNLETGRMGNYSNLYSGLANNMMSQAYGLATGIAPSNAMSGYSGAAGNLQSGLNSMYMSDNQRAAQEQAAMMSAFGSLGGGLGMMAGGKAGGK